LAACGSIGPARLQYDQIDYAQTLSDAGKQQTMFNLVRMRYADSPMFASVQQMVAGYTLQGTVQGGFQTFPSDAASSFGALQGTAQYTDRPTFTFAPLTGARFAEAYLRPIPPADILPLIQGSVPVDVLFRLVAQSIGPLQNTHPLGGPNRSGSPQFLPLLEDLRTLQETGVLRVRAQREKDGTRLFLNFDTRLAPNMEATVARVCGLLGVDCGREVEVVYGDYLQHLGSAKIPVLTRSLLSVLAAVAAEIQMPEEDVRSGQTLPVLPESGRPTIVVHTGPSRPASSYVAVQVEEKWFWVDRTDYPSKLAFSILEILKDLAESPSGAPPPVLTIATN
jgi:hypothetical protein